MFDKSKTQEGSMRFIQSLCLSSGLQYIQARVLKATPDHALWWAKYVQPEIAKDSARADRKWNWINLVNGTTPMIKIANLFHQNTHPYCIVVPDKHGKTLIAGMILLVEPYHCLNNHKEKAAFIWFLAAAPSSFLRRHLDNNRPRLLQAMIDTGIVFSYQNKFEGRIGLHADPQGGQELKDGYLKTGLQILPKNIKLPFGRNILHRQFSWEDAGAYFYADTEHALKILKQSDHLRTDSPCNDSIKKDA